MARYGYIYYPPIHPGEIGAPQLDIYLQAMPSGEHFDPELVTVPVVGEQAELQTIDIYHPWDYDLEYRVTAGKLVMIDQNSKHFEAFTYGGQLTITNSESETKCTLVSPAPILNLAPPLNAADFLATETEILWAERRAYWEVQPDEFERRLATAEPLELFHAVLDTLREKFRHFPPTEDALQHQFVHYLNEESRTIHDLYNLTVLARPLADIL